MHAFKFASIIVLMGCAATAMATKETVIHLEPTQTNTPIKYANSSQSHETVRIYENGQLVKTYQTNKPLVMHIKEHAKNGKQPVNETIRIKEHGPNSHGQEVIHFSNGTDNINNAELYNHIMHDQRHEEVMMQQFFNHMNHYLYTESERLDQDEQLYAVKHQQQLHSTPGYEPHFEQKLKNQDNNRTTNSWWGLMKSYF